MVDALSGNLVAEPLKRGGSHCLYHAVYFCAREVVVQDTVVVFLDLETTGLSILTDNIVEIGVVDEHGATFFCRSASTHRASWPGRAWH